MVRHISRCLVFMVLLAACGAPAAPTSAPTAAPTSAPTAAPTSAPTAAPTSAPTAAPKGVFPVTISHKYGTAEIPAEPQRVIALGYSEVDPILALGVIPIAVRDWFGEQPNAVWPWSQERLGGATPTVLTMPFGELNYESIAALKPDLIVATHAGITADEYATLAQIAPTLAQSGDVPDFGMAWQDQTRQIGRALGRAEAAERLVAEVEEQIASARAASPQIQGKSITWASPAEGESFWVVGPNTPPLRFLTALGMRYPDDVAAFVGDLDSAQLSSERLDLIDSDVLIFYAGSADARQRVERSPIFSALDAMAEGRTIFFVGADPIYGALSYSTVASLPYAIDRLLPMLTAAADGDPATAASPSGMRRITHAMGETQAPASPQRVVVLDTGELDNALALGVTPIGAPVAEAREYQSYLADQLDGIADIGAIGEPNLEAILALKPDLILGSKQRYEAIYPQLSAIAPTVFVESLRVPWQENLRLHAAALGREREAAELLAAYDARVAEIQGALGDDRGATTISVIRFRPGQVRLYLKRSFIGYILQDIGLGRPASQDQDAFSAEITLEQIADIDADYLFITGYAQGDSDQEQFLKSPLWLTLEAVKGGRAIDVDDDTWIAGLGAQAAAHVIEDLSRLVQGQAIAR